MSRKSNSLSKGLGSIGGGKVNRSVGNLPKIKTADTSSTRSIDQLPMYPGGSFPSLGLNKYRGVGIQPPKKNPYLNQKSTETMLVLRQ